jgi:glucoselysine-6-phosphate deglycase
VNRKFHYIVANGVNTALAYETALKVNETCFTPTAGYQLEQYIHGPRLATDAHSAVVLVAGPGSSGVLQRAYEAAAWAKVRERV